MTNGRLAIIAAVVALAQVAAAEPAVRVFDVQDRGAGLEPEALAEATDALAGVLGRSGAFARVCRAGSCAVAASDFVLVSDVLRVASRCILTTALYDPARAGAIASSTREGACTAEGLRVAADTAGAEVARPAAWDPGNPRPDCFAVCDRFTARAATTRDDEGSTRVRCLERCGSGDLRFAVCAWKARSSAEAAACEGRTLPAATQAAAPAPAVVLPPPDYSPPPGPRSAAEAEASGARPKCEIVCGRFIQAVAGSASIREPIERRCMDRFGAADLPFSVCAWKARTTDDVGACLSMPEKGR